MTTCIRANVDITIIEGGTFDQTFQWKTGSPLEAVDLTGYTGDMDVRAKMSDASPVIQVPSQAIAWAADGATGVYIYPNGSPPDDKGKYRVYIKDEASLGICVSHKDLEGAYDLFLKNPGGEVVFQMYGIAYLKAAATR